MAVFKLGSLRSSRVTLSPSERANRVKPAGPPIVAAVYLTESPAPIDARNAVHKEIGALIAETF